MNDPARDQAFQALVEYSLKIGTDPELIQGAGGNTSWKADGIMWVKASGQRLDAGGSKQIFLPVDLAACRAAVECGDEDAIGNAAISRDASSSQLRPSIETALHAIMPHACVMHLHSVNAIAYSIQPSASDVLAERLDGLNWARIPYYKPGMPLAHAVVEALTKTSFDVLVMDNHGLLVGGESAEATFALIEDVEARLEITERPIPSCALKDPAGLQQICGDGPFEPAPAGYCQALAFDVDARQSAGVGSLYPDHVVFLGPGIAIAEEGESPETAALRAGRARCLDPKCVVLPGVGVALERSCGKAGREMLDCLARVALRLRESKGLSTLSADQEAELVNWDAERYRQGLADAAS